MKKLFLALVILLNLFILVSCGSSDKTPTMSPELKNLPTEAPSSDGPPAE